MKAVCVPCSPGIPEPGVAASPLADAKKHGMTSLVQCIPHHAVQLHQDKTVHEQSNPRRAKQNLNRWQLNLLCSVVSWLMAPVHFHVVNPPRGKCKSVFNIVRPTKIYSYSVYIYIYIYKECDDQKPLIDETNVHVVSLIKEKGGSYLPGLPSRQVVVPTSV